MQCSILGFLLSVGTSTCLVLNFTWSSRQDLVLRLTRDLSFNPIHGVLQINPIYKMFYPDIIMTSHDICLEVHVWPSLIVFNTKD
jgi:hypothetical protein